ncbi:MAG: hypothetical protein LUH07_13785 [Lachnospiraceae bacterium]|nr:hypothetical protein [Lachnospiraceae bacterium]
MADGYEPVIHWITRQENYEMQEMLTARESRPTHADSTAAAAIGKVSRDSDRMRQRKNKVKLH